VKNRERLAWCLCIVLVSVAAAGWRGYGHEHQERLRERTRAADVQHLLEQQRQVQTQMRGILPHRDKPQIDEGP
jgi:hypothetical protein